VKLVLECLAIGGINVRSIVGGVYELRKAERAGGNAVRTGVISAIRKSSRYAQVARGDLQILITEQLWTKPTSGDIHTLFI
jgi:hypothetical protein